MTQKSTVRAGHFDQTVWVEVDGRGTFQVSAGLKEYTRRMIVRGYRQIVIDLENCELMDSTFMGTMAGIALRLREMGSGGLTVLRANPRNTALLENLGLDHLFSQTLPDGVTDPATIPSGEEIPAEATAGADDQRTTMIDAHETLVEISPANESKFRDVIELLKQEPHKESSES